MKVYTKTGDKGTTALFGGTRVPKDHLRIESYGTLDELNAHIGLLRDQPIAEKHCQALYEIQDRLFIAGAILATPPEKETLKSGQPRLNIARITAQDITFLENYIDEMETALSPMTHFVLPGGHPIVSYCHIARCVCRRAERLAVGLSHHEQVDEQVLAYLNRLSDFLFVMARKLTKELGANEIQWIPRK